MKIHQKNAICFKDSRKTCNDQKQEKEVYQLTVSYRDNNNILSAIYSVWSAVEKNH